MSVPAACVPLRRRRTAASALLLAVAGAAAAAAPADRAPAAQTARSGPTAYAASSGTLRIEPRHDLLGSFGLVLSGPRAEQVDPAGTRALEIPLQALSPVSVRLGDGAPTALSGGVLDAPGLRFRRADGAASPSLRLRPGAQALGWHVVDDSGGVWIEIGQAMRAPDARAGLRLLSADARVGPALARFAGGDGEGLLLGRVEFEAALALPADAAAAVAAKSCAAPNWSTSGFPLDVELTAIDRITSLRCRVLGTAGTCGGNAFSCDGPGGQEGEVVFVPDATLRNSVAEDAADVPWFTKFSGVFAPHGNDQHPFLVWSLWRLDADGGIAQIARSGLKHAFATANDNCVDATCPPNGHVLGRGCSDRYDAGSNDFNAALGPRHEVVPATGIWGRCGSVFDDEDTQPDDGLDGCDGIADAPPTGDCYRERMVVRETDIDPALHPGARWFIDAWYVVRDDGNVFNTMGYREIFPAWADHLLVPRWLPGTPGPFVQGPVLDLWLAAGPPAQTRRAVVTTPEGQLLVGSRVRQDGGGWLYEYAVMNVDLARASTAGTEPNLRVIASSGLDAFEVLPVHEGAAAEGSFSDGDADAANDWAPSASGQGVLFQAPAGSAQLAWGQAMSFSVRSAQRPGSGHVSLRHGAAGSPAQVQVEALVPDGSLLFVDGFEAAP